MSPEIQDPSADRPPIARSCALWNRFVMRVHLYLLLALIGALPCYPPTLRATPQRPNFLIILGDDISWDAFGCSGNPHARTPKIDAMAAESCRMGRLYCSVSQCAPLRAELYTGLWPHHNGILANQVKEPRPEIRNIADHLAPLGYRIGLTGKRHFSLGNRPIETIAGFPSDCNGSDADYSLDGVRAFIAEALDAGQGFCAVIGSIHAHHPWDLGERSAFAEDSLSLPPHFIDSPATRETLARHAAEVELLDGQVGDVAALLEEMDLARHTILIFLSEQGMAMPRGKWSPYDFGSRSLCLARWPGRILPRTTDAIAMYCDILPTLIELAGGDPDPKLDGRSLYDVWLDNQNVHREAAYISNVHPFLQKAIVTRHHKLIWTARPAEDHIFALFHAKRKFFSRSWSEWLARAKAGPDTREAAEKVARVLHPHTLELYQIDRDPYELNDMAGEDPARVGKLLARLRELIDFSGEPVPGEFPQVQAQSQNAFP